MASLDNLYLVSGIDDRVLVGIRGLAWSGVVGHAQATYRCHHQDQGDDRYYDHDLRRPSEKLRTLGRILAFKTHRLFRSDDLEPGIPALAFAVIRCFLSRCFLSPSHTTTSAILNPQLEQNFAPSSRSFPHRIQYIGYRFVCAHIKNGWERSDYW